MILYPADAHAPGLALNEPIPVKKIVLKVRLRTLRSHSITG